MSDDALPKIVLISNTAIPVQEALVLGSPHHDALLRALKDATADTRTRLSTAIELVDIIEIARAILKAISATLKDRRSANAWAPSKYDVNKLSDPDIRLDAPDHFFHKHATPKARVLFRITAKPIYHRVKRLGDIDLHRLCALFDSQLDTDIHREIREWITRFIETSEARKSDRPPQTQKKPSNASSRKRLPEADGNLPNKRRSIRESSNHATALAMQPSNTQLVDNTNQNAQSHQTQPGELTLEQDAFHMGNFAHLASNAGQGRLLNPSTVRQMSYEGQQSVQIESALGMHQSLLPHEQRQGQIPHGQHQELGQEQEQNSIDSSRLGGLLRDESGNVLYREFLF